MLDGLLCQRVLDGLDHVGSKSDLVSGSGLSRHDLLGLVRRIIDVDGSDDELAALAEVINAQVPHPDILELIYDDSESLSPEEIVDAAVSYRVAPIPLRPPPKRPVE